MPTLASPRLLVFVAILASLLPAQIRLPAIIGDHMVLQQETEAPLWGWARPGETIRARGTWSHDVVTAVADGTGRWQLQLRTPKAGGPWSIRLQASNLLILDDVLIGEVWVCSGQSNMQWALSSAANAEEEIATARHPRIRLFQAQRTPALEPASDCEGRWQRCTPESARSFSAVAYFFGRTLHHELHGVPIGLVHSSWGGTVAEAWTSAETLRRMPDFLPEVERLADLAAKKEETGADPEKPGFHRNSPTVLFNGMISPLIPFAIRGAIWYQGESNRKRAKQYRELFPALIADWRRHWDRGLFPFYFVQIAPFAYPDDTGEAAALREAQLLTMEKVPHTGMAVTMDIGNPKDIHPRNKQDVGRRLALWALAETYGRSGVVCSGPVYRSMTVEDAAVRLYFDHTQGGLEARGGALQGFTIAGNDGVFVPAEARIDGETIIVSSPSVPRPAAVRFAWGAADASHLFNGAGLPASSFRTDRPD